MITLYGIKNCDTVKRARNWLDSSGINYRFHDFRADGLAPEQLRAWITELGWEALVNKRSTTWKQLDTALREQMDEVSAVDTLLKHPTLIKRPVLDTGKQHFVGFSDALYKTITTGTPS
jgi:arsenate reductase (glutaredoxin)